MTRASAGVIGACVLTTAWGTILVGAWGLAPDGTRGHVAWFGALGATVAHALTGARSGHAVRRWTSTGALVTMVLLALAPPLFSDDVWRYVADGHVGAAGLNPWAWPPDSPKIRDLVGPWLDHINHPELPTIYPPVAQGVFAVLAVLGAGVTGFRLAAIAAWWLAAHVADTLRPCSDEQAGAGWWMRTHPLALLSVGANGHVDAFGVLALTVALAAWRRRHDVRGAIAVGLAAGIKLFPIGLVVALAGRRTMGRVGLATAVAAAVLAATYAPAVLGGGPAFGSLGRYAESWTFNAGPQAVVQSSVEVALEAAGVGPSVELRPVSRWREARGETTVYDGKPTYAAWYGRNEVARTVSRGVAVVALVVALGVIVRRRVDETTATTVLLVVLFGFSPVVHPWYLLWVLAPAAIGLHRPALVWCGSMVVAFGAAARSLDGGPWTDPLVSRLAVYGIPLAAMAVMARRGVVPFDMRARRDTVEGDSSDRT